MNNFCRGNISLFYLPTVGGMEDFVDSVETDEYLSKIKLIVLQKLPPEMLRKNIFTRTVTFF